MGMWRETYTQHFGSSTGDGTFDRAAEEDRKARPCTNAVTAQNDKEQAVLNFISQNHPHIAVVHTFDYASTRGDLKFGRKVSWPPATAGEPQKKQIILDCTHSCFSPFLSEVLLYRIQWAVVQRELGQTADNKI